MSYEHLRLTREAPLTQRHPRKYRASPPPQDVRLHGAVLAQNLLAVRQSSPTEEIGGFDDRKLLKIKLREGEKGVPNFQQIPGIEFVSQEAESIVFTLASEQGLNTLNQRLLDLAGGGKPTRKELLYSMGNIENITPEERTGAALREQGYPTSEFFLLDVELWPQEQTARRDKMLSHFLSWLRKQGIEHLDDLKQPSLVMVRLRCLKPVIRSVHVFGYKWLCSTV